MHSDNECRHFCFRCSFASYIILLHNDVPLILGGSSKHFPNSSFVLSFVRDALDIMGRCCPERKIEIHQRQVNVVVEEFLLYESKHRRKDMGSKISKAFKKDEQLVLTTHGTNVHLNMFPTLKIGCRNLCMRFPYCAYNPSYMFLLISDLFVKAHT